MEREVNLESLSHSFIPKVIRDRTWTPLLIGFGNVCNPIVRDFFLNEITLIVGLEEHSLPFLPHPFRTYFKSVRLLLNLLYHMMIEDPDCRSSGRSWRQAKAPINSDHAHSGFLTRNECLGLYHNLRSLSGQELDDLVLTKDSIPS